MTLEAGKQLGPYEVLSRTGADGMGEVYKATDTRLDPCASLGVPQMPNVRLCGGG